MTTLSLYTRSGALNSAPLFQAFERGARHAGHRVVHDTEADIAVIWSHLWAGRMSANQQIWHHYRRTGRSVMAIEVGLKRSLTWRILVNGKDIALPPMTDRSVRIGLDLKPWNDQGQHVVIALQRHESLQWQNMPAIEVSCRQQVDQLRQHTDRPIIVRPHPRGPNIAHVPGAQVMHAQHVSGTYDEFDFVSCIADTWAVINHNSNPGVEAILNGVPAFVHKDSRAAAVANFDLANIEQPLRPDRNQWFNELCHKEWLQADLESMIGHAIEHAIQPR